jgi:hypothetical protein
MIDFMIIIRDGSGRSADSRPRCVCVCVCVCFVFVASTITTAVQIGWWVGEAVQWRNLDFAILMSDTPTKRERSKRMMIRTVRKTNLRR